MNNQRKVILYIAMSLDGYIAKPDGDISFLDAMAEEGLPAGEAGEDYGYYDFVKSVDTVIMGRKTYDKILSFGILFPHADKKAYIITRQEKPDEGNTTFYNGDLAELILLLKSKEGKDIYLDGGAEVVNGLMKNHLIDEYIISVIPHFLGEGVKLFKEERPEEQLNLISSKAFPKGLVQLHYERKI